MTTVLDALNQGMHAAMAQDERVIFLGEDILDPYGGAFKVARGLSTKFPDRVMTTPISEAAIVGLANGMALRGLRPVVEIMFGDFLTLAHDQIANHAAKFRWMYNDQVRVPVVIRTPMGGRRGYGPTHSQSIEKHWLGTPGLRIVAPNSLSNPARMLQDAILRDDNPVLFVEHKLLYPCKIDPGSLEDFALALVGAMYPSTIIHPKEAAAQITFVCYGYMFELVREAMQKLLMEYEIFSEAVVCAQLDPLRLEPILESLRRTQRLVTVEEGGLGAGWGSHVVSECIQAIGANKLRAVKRVAARDLPIASTRVLENEILPSADSIVTAAIDAVLG